MAKQPETRRLLISFIDLELLKTASQRKGDLVKRVESGQGKVVEGSYFKGNNR